MKLNANCVGLRIKQARAAKGWTQTELARQLGVQRSSVVRWETGVSVPQRIPRLATLFGQPASWFLDKADEQVRTQDSERSVAHLEREIRRLNKRFSQPSPRPKATKDDVVLADVLHAWNRVNLETRLLVALLITGDWSYKLKLWNLNIAVGDEMLKAISSAHNIRQR